MTASESHLKSLLAKKGQARPSGLTDTTTRADNSPFADLALTEGSQDDSCGPRPVDEQIKMSGEADLFAVTGKTGEATNGHNVTEQRTWDQSETAEGEASIGGSLLQVDFRRWRLSKGALEVSEAAPLTEAVPLAEASELVHESRAQESRAHEGLAHEGLADKDAALESTEAPQEAKPEPQGAEQPVKSQLEATPQRRPQRTPVASGARPRRVPRSPAAQPSRSWSKVGWMAAAAVLFAGWFWMTGSDTSDSVAVDGKDMPAASSTPALPMDDGTVAVESSAATADDISTTSPPAEKLAGDGSPAVAASESYAAAPMQDPGLRAADVDGENVVENSAKGSAELTADTADAAPAAAEPQPENQAVVQTPAFDVVRIEADGNALIAGTASPGSELIVLDNGEPIGRVKVDAIGAWMLIPDKLMAQGDHEFSLVLNVPQGTVKVRFEETITRPSSPTESSAKDKSSAVVPVSPGRKPRAPRSGIAEGLAQKIKPKPQVVANLAGADISPPIPVRNPVQSDAAGESNPSDAQIAAFVIQLASAPNAVGAAQEWAKLQRRFPNTLRNMELKLLKVSDASQGTVYRVRTGPFAQRADAQAYCSRLKAQEQDCLVVER